MTKEFLAREFIFSVSTDDGSSWTEVKGISSWTYTRDVSEVDVTDFDDGGWNSTLVAGRSARFALEGNFLADPETGARDAGQEIIENAAEQIGYEGLIHFKVETRAATAATPPVPIGSISAEVSVKMNDVGGGANDKMPFACELIVRGKPTHSGIFA